MQASPFLVSRNRYLDYRTVVAPQFICDAGIANLLARAADSDLVESEDVFYRQVQGAKAGDFSIVFRISKARIRGSESSEEIVQDQFGREIYLLEGFVLQLVGQPTISRSDFERLHQLLIPKYEQFWAVTDSEPARPSPTIELRATTNPLPLCSLPAFQVSSKTSAAPPNEKKKEPRWWLLPGTTLVLLLLLSLLVGRILLGQPVPPHPQSGKSPRTPQTTETVQPQSTKTRQVTKTVQPIPLR